MHDLKELVGVIEEEIALGEQLLENLASQREAIISWDISALLSQIEEKESKLHSLAALEERRRLIVKNLGRSAEKGSSLQELLDGFPSQPDSLKLGSLRVRAREIYGRIQAEEKRLLGLMESLLEHIREALGPLSRPWVHLYGEKGLQSPQRPRSGLIQGKV